MSYPSSVPYRYSTVPQLRPPPGAPGQWRGPGPAAAAGAGQGDGRCPDGGPGGQRPLLLSDLPERPVTYDPWGANTASQQVRIVISVSYSRGWHSYLICYNKPTAVTGLVDTLTVRMIPVCRCLDESEGSAPAPPPPAGVPDCPICGKKFKSQKSRSTHLKRCSSDMGVSPAVLLQALQRQAEDTQNIPSANTLWVRLSLVLLLDSALIYLWASSLMQQLKQLLKTILLVLSFQSDRLA